MARRAASVPRHVLAALSILARTGAVASSLVTLIIPVSATVLGSLALGDPIVPRQLFGMALVAGGLVAADARLGALLRSAPAARLMTERVGACMMRRRRDGEVGFALRSRMSRRHAGGIDAMAPR
jgi:hypothetical protein